MPHSQARSVPRASSWAISTDQLSTRTPNGSGALQILSLLSDFLDFLRNPRMPHPSFAHGKRNGGD